MEQLSEDRHLEMYLSNDLNRRIYLAIDSDNKLTITESLAFFNILFNVLDVIEYYEWNWICKWDYLKNYLAQLEPNYQKVIIYFVDIVASERLDTSNADTAILLSRLKNLNCNDNTKFNKDVLSSREIGRNLKRILEGFCKVRGFLKSKDDIVKDFIKENENLIRKQLIPDKQIDSNEKLLKIIKDYIVDFVVHDIEKDGGYRYLWKDEKPLNESDSQPFIKILLNKYCEDSEISISRENRTGNGNVDFTFTDGKHKICLEIKNAHHDNVDNAIYNQLPIYMAGEKTKYGIFLVLWFKTENGYPFPTKYSSISELRSEIENNIPKDLIIDLIIINCTKPINPSKNKKRQGLT